MKRFLLGAGLALPMISPAAAAGVTFLSDVNQAGVSYTVTTGAATNGATVSGNASSGPVSGAASVSGASANATSTITSYSNTVNGSKALANTNGALSTTFGALLTTGAHKGQYKATVSQPMVYDDVKTTGKASLTASATYTSTVASTFANPGSASFTFAGTAGAAFGGTVANATVTTTPEDFAATYTEYATSNTVNASGLPADPVANSASATTDGAVTAGTPVVTTPGTVAAVDVKGSATTGASGNSVDYTFTAPFHGAVTVTSSNISASNENGVGYTIELLDMSTGGNLVGETTVANDSTGIDWTQAFSSGGTYSLEIIEGAGANAPDLYTATGGVAGPDGASSATFTATITSVPEVSTWVMMLAGFVGLGFAGAGRNAKSRRFA